jgi:hypothetical protein
VRVTNVATGESLDLNISGPGRILEDGETMILMGRWLNFVPDLGVVWLTTGRVVVERDPKTGNILSFISIQGQVEDICATLAG